MQEPSYDEWMRLQELVDVSNAVARTPSRLEKRRQLAALLKTMQDKEIQVGVAYLSGTLAQGRIGLGWSTIAQARATGAADAPSIELVEVDSVFEKIAHTSGAGASRNRAQLLADLLARATTRRTGLSRPADFRRASAGRARRRAGRRDRAGRRRVGRRRSPGGDDVRQSR